MIATPERTDLLSPAEAAAVLGIGTNRLGQFVREGRIQAFAAVGGVGRIYQRSEVEAFAIHRAMCAETNALVKVPPGLAHRP